MERMHASLAAGLLSILVAATARAGAEQHDLSLPLNDINNPCTSVVDGIDGSLDLHGVTQHNGNVAFLQVNAKGKGADAWGRKYQLGGKAKFEFHDPLPANIYLRLRMTSQGSTDNAGLVLSLHVNEQGIITHAEYSGVECRG
ncbi:MAG TPA: hypothetical protein VFV15_00370 [Moraxellaceae bacterium]|nr:hypothetical protein [Moraxellaceae bacterium]